MYQEQQDVYYYITLMNENYPHPGMPAGALVKLYAGGAIMTRQVQAAGGYLSQSSNVLHFGLGERTQLDRVEIRWPSGVEQRLENVAANQIITITEPGAKAGKH